MEDVSSFEGESSPLSSHGSSGKGFESLEIMSAESAINESAISTKNRYETVNANYTIIFGIFVLASLWTLFLTFIPVFSTNGIKPNNIYKPEPGWYTGSDVMRFIEPGLFFSTI